MKLMYKPAHSTLNDKDLLELLHADSEFALAAIYDRYWSKLYLQAYSIIRDRHIAEDIVQEIIVQLWMKRSVVHIVSLNAYLYSAVRYQVFKAIRSGKSIENIQLENLSTVNDTDSTLIEKDIQRLVDEGVAELPEKCRQIFKLSRREHLSTKEIAIRLGIAPKTVENQLTIALRRLRSVLGDILIWLFLIVIF